MEKMNDLRDLLQHEVEDLYSAEEQIIDALPGMIDKASNSALKNSLNEHLRITEKQKTRLDQVLHLLTDGKTEENGTRKKKFLGIFGGPQKCKGMEGIIGEGKKMMGEDMDPDVMDAALIACAQKIEHYEICGYGTARSYAEELGLQKVASLLEQTLDEEYDADDKLTFLAESRINKQAERNRAGTSESAERSVKNRSTETVRSREMEMEPVSSRKQRSENKETSSGRGGGQPKATSTPRASSGRTAAGSPKRTTGKTKTSSKSSGSTGRSSRSGNSRGR